MRQQIFHKYRENSRKFVDQINIIGMNYKNYNIVL